MDYRSQRVKNLFVNSTTLDSLKEPINKIMKPSQIYNDYFPQDANPKKHFNSIKQENDYEKNLPDHSETCFNYQYYKNNTNLIEFSKRFTSPKKINSLSPSPIRDSAIAVLSKRSGSKTPSRYPLPEVKLKNSLLIQKPMSNNPKPSKSGFY
jgi:hypothetical protein